ncbi:hypothetical protein CEE44_00700 [Candidatus Woesearchaeota archaeon B3_Woes]|nr:MAG: hypothetical protein CEE44_00700 [Candidatus Woesearchaeota archaeon B3_Woes]
MKYATKSVLVARLPRKGNNEFKTASIKLFEINNPHKTDQLPTENLEFENIEKIKIKNQESDYFLEGNDIIINNLEFIHIDKKGSTIELS